MDHRRKGEERALSFYLGVMSDRKNYEPSRDLPNLFLVVRLAGNTDKNSWLITRVDDAAELEVESKVRITINYFQLANHPILKVRTALRHKAVGRIIDSYIDRYGASRCVVQSNRSDSRISRISAKEVFVQVRKTVAIAVISSRRSRQA